MRVDCAWSLNLWQSARWFFVRWRCRGPARSERTFRSTIHCFVDPDIFCEIQGLNVCFLLFGLAAGHLCGFGLDPIWILAYVAAWIQAMRSSLEGGFGFPEGQTACGP